jgi:riboflavin transporter FmnP
MTTWENTEKEKTFVQKPAVMSTKKLVRLALLGALSALLMHVVSFPLPFLPAHMSYDPGDVPAIIAAFAMGPWYGFLVEAVKVAVTFVTGGINHGPVGAWGNFSAGAVYALMAGYIYKTNKNMVRAILSMAAGCVATTVVMCLNNYYILLPYFGIPKEQITWYYILIGVMPFNLVKTVISSLISFLIYKRVRKFLEV